MTNETISDGRSRAYLAGLLKTRAERLRAAESAYAMAQADLMQARKLHDEALRDYERARNAHGELTAEPK